MQILFYLTWCNSLFSKGGRTVLCLYGYSHQQPDGLSFPDNVTDPDVGRVAAVTLEVMSLRMELEMLIKVRTSKAPRWASSLRSWK